WDCLLSLLTTVLGLSQLIGPLSRTAVVGLLETNSLAPSRREISEGAGVTSSALFDTSNISSFGSKTPDFSREFLSSASNRDLESFNTCSLFLDGSSATFNSFF